MQMCAVAVVHARGVCLDLELPGHLYLRGNTTPYGHIVTSASASSKRRGTASDKSQTGDEALNLRYQGAVSIRKTVLPGMAIPMLKIRRPYGRLIFNMEIAICW